MDDYVLTRRSVRKFKNELINKNDIDLLIRAGFSAPTARNQKSKQFVIIDNKDILNKLSMVSNHSVFIKDAPLCIAVIGEEKEKLMTPLMENQDLASATTAILIMARSLNIGSCWIGISPVEDRMQKAKKILGINDGRFVFSLIALGYPIDDKAFYDTKKEDYTRVYYNEVK